MSIPDESCPFCAIIAGDAPATVIHETETMVCILDAYPVSDGHALLAPREHAERMGENDGSIINPAIALGTENFHR